MATNRKAEMNLKVYSSILFNSISKYCLKCFEKKFKSLETRRVAASPVSLLVVSKIRPVQK